MCKELKIYLGCSCGVSEDCIKTLESFQDIAMRHASEGNVQCLDKVHYHIHGVVLGLAFCGYISTSSVDSLTDWLMTDSLLEFKAAMLRRCAGER